MIGKTVEYDGFQMGETREQQKSSMGRMSPMGSMKSKNSFGEPGDKDMGKFGGLQQHINTVGMAPAGSAAPPKTKPRKKKSNQGWGRGAFEDFKASRRELKRELTNFDSRTLPVVFFMFFVAIAPAITFGAVYEHLTGHWIGPAEMIAATAWVGIVYSLIGGQPTVILGGTGPVLVFTAALYKYAEKYDVPFLTLNAWVGLWVAAFCMLAAFVNLNRIILCLTRFTHDIFALLVSAIFVVNALGNPFSQVGIYHYFDKDHKSHNKNENEEGYSHIATGILSLGLALGTASLASLAMMLRTTTYRGYVCSASTRTVFSSLSVTLAIFTFIVVDHFLFPTIKTETLNVPDEYGSTFTCCTPDCRTYWPDDCPDIDAPYWRRYFLIDLTDLNGNGWVPIGAIIPAFLAFILVFLDDGITLHLMNHPSHKLTHGDAYNLNTLIIGIMIGINSLLGFPWLVSATVRSLAHLHAMADKNKDGKIELLRETRLTGLFVHLLMLCSLLFLPWLKLIPVPVLYGVFLYMGISSLNTNQFYGRIQMLFMNPSRYPETPYTSYVDRKTLRFYTGIQLFFFVLLYAITSIEITAIWFPVSIAICIPVRRFLLPKVIASEALVLLDGEDHEIEEFTEKLHIEKF